MKRQFKIKTGRRLFSIEVPPAEWILKFDCYNVGRLKNGTVIVLEHWVASDGEAGVIARRFKSFAKVFKSGEFDAALRRALAHKLGIKRFRWENAYTWPIWFDTDDYFPDAESPEETRAHQELVAAELEKQAGPEPAAAFRKQVGLPPAGRMAVN